MNSPLPYAPWRGTGWVYRAADELAWHSCRPPTRPWAWDDRRMPDGRRGDVWRCDCRRGGRYWVVGLACYLCDAGGHGNPPRGSCVVGLTWRPISRRRALRHVRRARRTAQRARTYLEETT